MPVRLDPAISEDEIDRARACADVVLERLRKAEECRAARAVAQCAAATGCWSGERTGLGKWFERWIEADENLSFVAVAGSRVCGFALLQREGFLRLLYVAPEARLQGVSKAMLAAVEDTARSLGLAELKLESSYTARDFYAARGYEPDGDSTPRHHPMKKRLTLDPDWRVQTG